MISTLLGAFQKSLSLAGSVHSFGKLDFIKKDAKYLAFTIGGAFFEKKFGDTFAGQIEVVTNYGYYGSPAYTEDTISE